MGTFGVYQFLGRAFKDDVSALGTALGAYVYDVVGQFYDVRLVFDDQHGMAAIHEGVEGQLQFPYVVEVQAGGGFVEDEERVPFFLGVSPA